jgi:hypothetical protein
MANLLGLIVGAITFPGIYLHNWSRKFFAERVDVPVEEAQYKDMFLITIAPLIINTIAALLMFVLGNLIDYEYFYLFFNWLGISFGMHAFPNNVDAKHIWNKSQNVWRENPVALIGFPFVITVFVANLLSIVWFDLIYALILHYVTDDLMIHVIS